MLGSLPDAEDAVQETLLRAWRYRDSLKEGTPLRPRLYRVWRQLSTCRCMGSKFRWMRSTPTERVSTRLKLLVCLAKTGVNVL
jgi:DNA-directed RNA polymerase specialized sigma24 family protein